MKSIVNIRGKLKKTGLLLTVVGCGLLACTLVVAKEPAKEFKISENGKGLQQIIVPANASKCENFSGRELQKYLKKITGVELAIVAEKEGTDGGIYIGRTAPGINALKDRRLSERDVDAFLMEANDGKLVLAGNCDRSTLYAVYAFLEKLGCLWLAPGIDEIPRIPDLKITDFSKIEEPAFKIRSMKTYASALYSSSSEMDKECYDWSVKHRMNVQDCTKSNDFMSEPEYIRERGGVRAITRTHCMHKILTPEVCKEHPEWVAMVNGKREWRIQVQPCTSNPAFIDYCAEHLKKVFAARPEIEVFNLSQSDGRQFCECPECTALDTGEERPIGVWPEPKRIFTKRNIVFANRVAEKIAASCPGKKLQILAYGITYPPPDPAIIKPLPNVSVMVCHPGCFYHSYTNNNCQYNARFLKDLSQWVAVAEGGIGLYDYYPAQKAEQQASVDYKKIFSDLKKVKEIGVVDVRPQTAKTILGILLVSRYAMVKAIWNPNADPEAVMAPFFKAMYKESADDVKKFCDVLEAKKEAFTEHTGREFLPYLTKAVIEEAEPYIIKAMSSAKTDETRQRVKVLYYHFLMAKGMRLALDTFAQYESSKNITLLKEAIEHLKNMKMSAEEADKNPFCKKYGIIWHGYYGKGCFPDSYLSKWEKLLKANQDFRVPAGKGVKTGVYIGGTGASQIVSALSRTEGINPFLLPRLDKDMLSSCDVIVIPNTGSMADSFNKCVPELRDWVKNGGRVILLHDAAGYKKHEAAFPEIGKGKNNLQIKEMETVSPLSEANGLKTGERFSHAYYDHVAVEPGENGKTIIKDANDNAVVVAGRVGKGKVVLDGMMTGYSGSAGGKEEETEPDGGELKILENAVKWLADK